MQYTLPLYCSLNEQLLLKYSGDGRAVFHRKLLDNLVRHTRLNCHVRNPEKYFFHKFCIFWTKVSDMTSLTTKWLFSGIEIFVNYLCWSTLKTLPTDEYWPLSFSSSKWRSYNSCKGIRTKTHNLIEFKTQMPPSKGILKGHILLGRHADGLDIPSNEKLKARRGNWKPQSGIEAFSVTTESVEFSSILLWCMGCVNRSSYIWKDTFMYPHTHTRTHMHTYIYEATYAEPNRMISTYTNVLDKVNIIINSIDVE